MTHIILLIAALAEEADAFMPGQGHVVEAKPHPMRVIEQPRRQIKIVTCGLGKVNAALGGAGIAQYRAGDWPMGKACDPAFTAMPDPGSGLPHASIISGDVFLECPAAAKALAVKLNAQLVDMEVAAVAQAAEALGLPWCAIKAVTDDADCESASDFSANLKRAARKAGVAMEALCLTIA
ncbi:MAG: purine phosphorylase [Sphingorhabdus sp.]